MNRRTAITEQHYQLARRLAARFHRSVGERVSYDELLSMSVEGLLDAAHRYDPARGTFTTFAYHRICGAILSGLRALGMPRVGRDGRFVPHVSLDSMLEEPAVNDEQGGPSAAQLDEQAMGLVAAQLDHLSRMEVRRALTSLPARERAALVASFFHDLSLDCIGQQLGVSRSQASRLRARGLSRLREQLDADVVLTR